MEKKFSNNSNEQKDEAKIRVKLPKKNEVIGVITQRLGSSRMYVSCMDGKTRNCRVPGSKRRGLWLKENDVVLIKPWEFDDEKGDLEYKYTPIEAERLRRIGQLQTSTEEF
ncbi:MAG: translation initiation factor eIF-1A [Candidatus Pacearchaeota archaeon]